MPRFTTLRLAGIAAVLSAGNAFAADMIGHRAPPPLAPPPAHIDTGSGFYLRGDIGVGLYDYSKIDTVPFLPGLTTRDSSINAASAPVTSSIRSSGPMSRVNIASTPSTAMLTITQPVRALAQAPT